jgi:osmotically-inducible protein OsmY
MASIEPRSRLPIGGDEASDDASVTARVEAELARAAPAATGVRVSTQNGIVTLAGRVDSELMRERVVALAITTSGVSAVNDQPA